MSCRLRFAINKLALASVYSKETDSLPARRIPIALRTGDRGTGDREKSCSVAARESNSDSVDRWLKLGVLLCRAGEKSAQGYEQSFSPLW